MGGRGGGSGRGGGGGVSREQREKTGHLAPDSVGYERGIQLLMQETGLSRSEAELAYNAMDSYFGSGYHAIRAGHPPSAAQKGKLIDNALKKARPFNGTIYRGIRINADEYGEWSQQLKKGGTIDMKGISSWSSKQSVANSFAGSGMGSGQSVIFTVKSTRHAAPVQHLSSFGSNEAEVLAPSSVRYRVGKVVTQGHTTYVNLTEVG